MKETEKKIITGIIIVICILLFVLLLYFVSYMKKELNNNNNDKEIIITKNYASGYSGIYPTKNDKKVKEYNIKDFLYDGKEEIINFKEDFKDVMLKKDNIKYFLTCNKFDNKCKEVLIKLNNNGFLVSAYYNLESDVCYNDTRVLFYNDYIVMQRNKYCEDDNNLNIYKDGALIKSIPNSVNQFKYVHNDMVSSLYPVRIFENRIHYLVYNDKITEKYISLDNITKDEFVRTYNGVPVSKE